MFLYFNTENEVSVRLYKNLTCIGHSDRAWEDTFSQKNKRDTRGHGAEVGFKPCVGVSGRRCIHFLPQHPSNTGQRQEKMWKC